MYQLKIITPVRTYFSAEFSKNRADQKYNEGRTPKSRAFAFVNEDGNPVVLRPDIFDRTIIIRQEVK